MSAKLVSSVLLRSSRARTMAAAAPALATSALYLARAVGGSLPMTRRTCSGAAWAATAGY